MLLDMAADGLGERTAIGPRAGGLSFTGLRHAAAARAASGPGGPVLAFVGPNGPAVPVSLFAAAWSGASYAPLNYRLPASALRQLVAEVNPERVVCASELVSHLGEGGPALELAEDWGGPVEATATAPGYAEAPGRPAVLLFTSGTSAAPKAAALDHANLLSYVLNTVEFASAGEDEAVLLSVPPFHIAGVAAVLSSCYAGRRVVPLASFSAEGWLAAVGEERITHAFVVPTMLARIVAALETSPDAEVGSIRNLSYGGARMPLPVLERALRLFPEAGFVNAYGLTETSSTVSVLGPDDHRVALHSDDPDVRARLGSAGRPLPGVEVAITDESGRRLPAGEAGEIRVSGAQVGGHYLNRDDDNLESGWLRTGDIGYVDSDGYLFVTGRADDVIIRGGENISPAEVEDALLRHPAVVAAAVVGLPDEEWGESVAAMVALRPDTEADGDAIAAWAAERLGSLKTPELLVVRPELPVTATGKVLRRQVRDELGAERSGP